MDELLAGAVDKRKAGYWLPSVRIFTLIAEKLGALLDGAARRSWRIRLNILGRQVTVFVPRVSSGASAVWRGALVGVVLLAVGIPAATIATLVGVIWLPSLAAWPVAAGLEWLNLRLFANRKRKEFSAAASLGEFTDIELVDQKVSFSVLEEKIRERLSADWMVIGGRAFAAVLSIGLLLALERLFPANTTLVPVFVGEAFRVAALTVSSAAAVWLIHETDRRFPVSARLASAMHLRLAPLVRQINDELERASADLGALTVARRRVAQHWDLPVESTWESEIGGYLNAHRDEILSQREGLSEFLAGMVARERYEHDEMLRARDAYRATDTLFEEVSRDASKTGLMPLIREIDLNYRKLKSKDLDQKLRQGDWSGYQQTVEDVAAEFKRLKQLSTEHFHTAHDGQRQKKQESRQQEERRQAPTAALVKETPEERAFRILRLPASADGKSIQQAYRWLARIWHPDTGMTKDDAEMKEINWAYNFLKKAGKL